MTALWEDSRRIAGPNGELMVVLVKNNSAQRNNKKSYHNRKSSMRLNHLRNDNDITIRSKSDVASVRSGHKKADSFIYYRRDDVGSVAGRSYKHSERTQSNQGKYRRGTSDLSSSSKR